MEMTTEPAKDINSEARNKLGDFLLAEYVHMSESFLRNEESGEKRAAFFVTLVGASGGILGSDIPCRCSRCRCSPVFRLSDRETSDQARHRNGQDQVRLTCPSSLVPDEERSAGGA
jgi:hypothetical protein